MRPSLLSLAFAIFCGLAPVGRAAPAPADAGNAAAAMPAVAVHRIATKEELELLNDALMKVAREAGRWAYTETTLIKDEKGKVKQDKVVRHDPSKPYAEQDVPLQISGKPPTEKELKDYRSRGEKRGRRIEDRERLGQEPPPKQSVGDLVDLSRALIVGDGDGRLTYELPLRKLGNTRFPPEKFQVFVRVVKEGRLLEQAGVKLREPLRAKLIVKISSGEASADFAVVDPKFSPAMTAVRGTASASIMFISVGGNVDLKRTDLKHVRPFEERFDVQIGPMKALDF